MSQSTQSIEVATNAQDGATTEVSVKQTQFKVGWSYDVFLRKNQVVPSEHAQKEWLQLSREHSQAHVVTIAKLAAAGAKVKCRAKAVFNAKDNRFDTALGVIVIQPGCNDSEMIIDAITGAQHRFSNRITAMQHAARHQGVL